MATHLHMTAEVPATRELTITLPADFPQGQAEIEVVSHADTARAKTLGDLLDSEFFGMWRDREDITDSVEYAKELRRRAWTRQK